MKMSKFEKKFVNSQKHAEKNIAILDRLIDRIDTANIKNVLEIGCGIGALASYLSNIYKWEITGTDLDPEQIARAKENNKDNKFINFFEADAVRLPFGNKKFDLVLSFLVLHHIPTWNDVFAETERLLKPGGYYVIYDVAVLPVFTAKGFRNILEKHMGVYTLKDIVGGLRSNKFEIVYEKKPKTMFLMSSFGIISRKTG